MDFALSTEVESLRQRVRAFVRAHVLPMEAHEDEEAGLPAPRIAELRARAKAEGLFTPQLSRDLGGLGLDTVGLCVVFEEAGYSPLGPLALHCAAPDEGNMHLLHRAASAAQKERYLLPLARGEVRSCFALTEPAPGAGSDPTMLLTRAERRGDRWVIDGRKWFTSGALGAGFAIVAAVTDPNIDARKGTTLFLVDAGTPGFTVERPIPTMGSGGPGGHCEVTFSGCAVSDEQVLGRLGEGFALMQQRLGPARLTHCMRWLGASNRAMDVALPYARERHAFGKALGEHQAVGWMLADSHLDMHASRLMVMQAAWLLDRGDQARVETSMCKVFVAEAVGRVIDRCIQVCGVRGFSRDLILERLYRDVRAFRIYDGPSEVHRMVIARYLLKGDRAGEGHMNEADWVVSADSKAMLDYLEGRASARKLRLFACACVRRYWRCLGAPSYRKAVETAERFADDLVGVGELQQARERAEALAPGASSYDVLACQASAQVVAEDAMEAARNVVEFTRRQAVHESAESAAFYMGEAEQNAAASAAELQAQAELLREVFGNPFRPARLEHAWVRWNNGTVVALAREILDSGRFAEMPYLADALLDAGCTNEPVLRHCQQTTGHVRGCWVLDLVLGGE